MQIPLVPDAPEKVQATVDDIKPSPAKESSGQPIRVLLADDSPVVRNGLAHLLRLRPGIAVVGQASDGLETVRMAMQLQPDIVIMDVNMPVLDGIEATHCIHQGLPNVRVLGLSMHNEKQMIDAMSVAGASGYLTKTAPLEALVAAIRQAASAACGSRAYAQ